MKKFKTKSKTNRIKIFIIIIVFLIIFICLSFCKLNKPHSKLTSVLLNNFNNNTNYSLRFLTSNLDNLFNSYSFYEEIVTYNENSKKIYLYNTHSNEIYNDKTTIQKATNLLKDNLVKLGINTIVEQRKTSDLTITGLSFYDISKTFIKDIMKKEKDIAYYIDIHRDSVSDTTIKINDKNYAKILFVLGLENKNYLKNKAVIQEMNEYLNKNYPGISKGIYEKKGKGVDGVYNQDLGDNVILIEIGGVTNNLDEINNSTEIIALMLYHMLGDNK